MALKQHNSKQQFWLKIVYAFLVILCCIFAPIAKANAYYGQDLIDNAQASLAQFFNGIGATFMQWLGFGNTEQTKPVAQIPAASLMAKPVAVQPAATTVLVPQDQIPTNESAPLAPLTPEIKYIYNTYNTYKLSGNLENPEDFRGTRSPEYSRGAG
jgi:hypothetical protein